MTTLQTQQQRDLINKHVRTTPTYKCTSKPLMHASPQRRYNQTEARKRFSLVHSDLDNVPFEMKGKQKMYKHVDLVLVAIEIGKSTLRKHTEAYLFSQTKAMRYLPLQNSKRVAGERKKMHKREDLLSAATFKRDPLSQHLFSQGQAMQNFSLRHDELKNVPFEYKASKLGRRAKMYTREDLLSVASAKFGEEALRSSSTPNKKLLPELICSKKNAARARRESSKNQEIVCKNKNVSRARKEKRHKGQSEALTALQQLKLVADYRTTPNCRANLDTRLYKSVDIPPDGINTPHTIQGLEEDSENANVAAKILQEMKFPKGGLYQSLNRTKQKSRSVIHPSSPVARIISVALRPYSMLLTTQKVKVAASILQKMKLSTN